MELSRRGMLGGLGAVCAVGAVGFAGAASIDDTGDGGAGSGGGDGSGDGDGSGGGDADGSGGGGSVAVDPDAPFEARLLSDGTDDRRLFGASDLDRVEGVFPESDEYLVYVALGDAGIEAFQDRLVESGATGDPAGFVVTMRLDDTEVRRVDLDESTVTALVDDEWGGVLTLPFDEESVAESVYESLAAA